MENIPQKAANLLLGSSHRSGALGCVSLHFRFPKLREFTGKPVSPVPLQPRLPLAMIAKCVAHLVAKNHPHRH